MKRVFMASVMIAALLAAAGAQTLAAIDVVPGLQPGSIRVLTMRGEASRGQVWGTGVYTSDSSLASAAVHAGVLADGQTGTVVVEVLPGAASYEGSSRYGVTSSKWGSFGKSFRFLAAVPAAGGSGQPLGGGATAQPSTGGAPAQPVVQPAAPPTVYAFTDDTALNRITPVSGAALYMRVTGTTGGRLWGTGVYTIDSAPAAAAVHAGALAAGQTAVVRITILPGRSSYEGSARNNVSSSSYGSYGASYAIEAAPAGAAVVPMITDPGAANRIQGVAAGQTYAIWVTGRAASGSIWGSGVYTADSPFAAAAVHAGLLADGAAGPVVVRIMPGQASYEGSARNGVVSASYGSYGLSYALEAAGR
ncbi:hypothetical protein LWX53_07265 [bacterium]|nr:hypothetical protein [bacterium]